MSFKEDLAEAKAAPLPESDPIDVVIGKNLYTLQFVRAGGKLWAATTAMYPATSGSLVALRYGYDAHAVVQVIAEKTGTVRLNGEVVELLVEKKTPENPTPVNEWSDLFGVLDGHSFSLVADAIWALNEWGPEQQVAALKKASLIVSAPSSD